MTEYTVETHDDIVPIPNPYHETNLVIKLINAEPKGEYDFKFDSLTRSERREELYAQLDRAAETTIRLSNYVKKHASNFWNLPPEKIYENLCEVAFGTLDKRITESQFSQNERMGFKLAIHKFIAQLPELAQYSNRFANNPKLTAEGLLSIKFDETPTYEVTPVGIVIYLDELDYLKIENYSNYPRVQSAGMTLFWSSLNNMRGRVMLIDRGTIDKPKDTSETYRHELRHVMFNTFLHGHNHIILLIHRSIYEVEDHLMS